MEIRLHEIELHARDLEASKKFYNDTLEIPINVDQEGLKCFGTFRSPTTGTTQRMLSEVSSG